MSYIGASPTTAAFPYDQFSGNGTTTAFTMSYAPASTTSIVVSISGVVQNPNAYSVSGLTLTFSAAPPTGTNNIGVLYLGLPASGVSTPGNTAYLSSTQFTATAGQTTFTPSGTYQTGFVNVIRNGSQLAPSDYTATNGTTVVLANACVAGDVVVIEVYNLTSVTNALPLTGGTVTGATTFNSTVSINGANGSGYTGYKNRIINGGMVIDQRNNGASVTVNSAAGSNFYAVDRFFGQGQTADGVFTMQRSSTAPAGFINSLLATVTTADSSLGATQVYQIVQPIEGYNVADLAWGTASAATVTLSFWVRSSLTGTFGGSLFNATAARSYPFSYIINSANTFEQKTITIAGDTTGTWGTGNGVGIYVIFSLGTGSTYSGTAGAWAGTQYNSATGATNLMATNGATFYITGVQLERGSNATSFEFIDYGRSLIQCQRYFEILTLNSTTGNVYALNMFAYSATDVRTTITYKVTKRAAPSCAFSGTLAVQNSTKASSISSFSFDQPGTDTVLIYNPSQAGFTVGVGLQANSTVSLSTISYSAEL